MEYSVELVTAGDLPKIMELVAEEGWQGYSSEDLQFILDLSPGSSFKLNCRGNLVGFMFLLNIAAVSYISFFLVQKRFRNYHSTRMLVARAFGEQADRPELTVIYANQKLVKVYERSGFRIIDGTRRFRCKGRKNQLHQNVSCLESRLEELAPLDRACYGYDRSALNARLLRYCGARAFMHQTSGRIDGCIFLRRCLEQYVIGPLSAANDQVAKHLLMKAFDELAGESIIFDAPESKFSVFAAEMGIGCEKDTTLVTKMYLGQAGRLENEQQLYIVGGHHFS